MAELRQGEAAKASALFEKAIAAGSPDVALWLAFAQARAQLGDRKGQGAAIDRALALEPRHTRALVRKGDWLAGAGDARAAVAYYTTAIKTAPQTAPSQSPGEIGADLQHARNELMRFQRMFEDFIRSRLDAAGLNQSVAAPRFLSAVDILLGKKQLFLQEPRRFYYPELPQIQFYPKDAFAWLAEIEAATDVIREELRRAISEGGGFSPYVKQDPSRPFNRQHGMADNPAWSAYYLVKDGAAAPGAERCPATMAALKHAPFTQIRGRAPSVLFSLLKAGSRIPPHNGMINARLICHLPLIVPDGCRFRVGNETRNWVEGEAWVFDDSIEHEAWNDSGQDRYILIFDVWRPELSPEESAAVATLLEAVDEYAPTERWTD
jgi:aspartyl/asparaginyl beta-hydroxylase (cupin superfamily)